jgi:hypothetical protein
MQPATLLSHVQSEFRKWSYSTKIYGTINVVVRLFLIAASSIVAAEKTLGGSAITGIVRWVPALALGVTIITALDAWLKPRDKWRGFMEDRDDIEDLLIRIQAAVEKTGSGGSADVLLEEEFSKLRRRHREKNVY